MKRIGVIINPIAGVGGQAGYKGSDDAEMRRRAMDAGYKKTLHYGLLSVCRY